MEVNVFMFHLVYSIELYTVIGKVILILLVSLIWPIRSFMVFDILVVCGFWYRAFYQLVVLFIMCSVVRIQQNEVPSLARHLLRDKI